MRTVRHEMEHTIDYNNAWISKNLKEAIKKDKANILAYKKETFANLISLTGSNDLEYLELVNRYLPNHLKKFDEIIRGIF